MIRQQRLPLKRIAALTLSCFLLSGLIVGCASGQTKNTANVSTYTPPVNEDGYIVITIPQTLLGGKTAEELEEASKKELEEIDDKETLKRLAWSALVANEDGTFSYYLTQEQYSKLKDTYYWLGCLRDPYTAEISEEFVTGADYTKLDENGIPWGITVSVDADTYDSMELWYSALVSVSPAIFLGRYQVLCGIPSDEWAVHVTVKNAENGEVILENDFPTRDE